MDTKASGDSENKAANWSRTVALEPTAAQDSASSTPCRSNADTSVRSCCGGGNLPRLLGVRDTGPGLAADQQARLFRRFEQGAGAASGNRYGGSGLGLAISQELAAAMGGSISVRSEPGRGASFRVELPLPASSSAPPAAEAPPVLVLPGDALAGTQARLHGRVDGFAGQWPQATLRAPAEPGLIHLGDAWHTTSPQLGQGANMALLDAMAFSRGRFAIDVNGLPSLYLPAWPEVGRVIEDCRK